MLKGCRMELMKRWWKVIELIGSSYTRIMAVQISVNGAVKYPPRMLVVLVLSTILN